MRTELVQEEGPHAVGLASMYESHEGSRASDKEEEVERRGQQQATQHVHPFLPGLPPPPHTQTTVVTKCDGPTARMIWEGGVR